MTTTQDDEVDTTAAPAAEEQRGEGEQNEEDDVTTIEFSRIKYGIEAFYAMVTPVTIAMLLSASCVAFLTSEDVAKQKEQVLSNSYTVFDVGESSSATSAQKLGLSVANGLIIIAVFIVMTFVVVLLYKYRCMKCLIAYFSISIALLLGLLGGDLVLSAAAKYHIPMDKFSFFFILYNFAMVGLAAIFYGRGFPTYIKQGYMVVVSVILAWQLSHFNAWTAWVLLVLLALYDLYAVLTPCGPLKALVKLMQREDAPNLPGLLYEAQLPVEARRRREDEETAPTRETDTTNDSNNGEGNESAEGNEPASTSSEPSIDSQSKKKSMFKRKRRRSSQESESANSNKTGGEASISTEDEGKNDGTSTQSQHSNLTVNAALSSPRPRELPPLPTALSLQSPREVEVELLRGPDAYPSATIPLALAKLYRLPIVENGQITSTRDRFQNASQDQLREEVLAIFPRNGGRIELIPSRRRNREKRYAIIDREGNIKRTLFVNHEGKIFEVKKEEEKEPNDMIRLGLGDFVFYSLLVAKASTYSYTTFIVSIVVILAGLGMTLILLSIKKQALPALPVSILLGVAFYFLTIYLVQPWVHQIFLINSYV